MIILHKALIALNKHEVVGFLTKKQNVYHISTYEGVSYPVLEETIVPYFPLKTEKPEVEQMELNKKQNKGVDNMILEKLVPIQKRENLNEVFSVDDLLTDTHHRYQIVTNKPIGTSGESLDKLVLADIQFQKGARKEPKSIPGVIDSDLLEIVRDRLKGFQLGKYPSEYNAKALEHVETALMYLNRRVEDRIERCVLGTSNK